MSRPTTLKHYTTLSNLYCYCVCVCVCVLTFQRGLTALHDASMEGHGRIVLLLLALGADITSCTKDGWTCLMSACSNGHYQMASILISTGSSIDAQTKVCSCTQEGSGR